MENEQEQTMHDKNFEKWAKSLPEDRTEEIFNWFYADLRQSNGLLIDFGSFIYQCWQFMTLEGQQFLEKRKEFIEICDDCREEYDMDPGNKYHRFFIRWKLGNKSLMFDLYDNFYELLMQDNGEVIDFDEFLFAIWRFTTLEGRDFQIEIEKEIIADHQEV